MVLQIASTLEAFFAHLHVSIYDPSRHELHSLWTASPTLRKTTRESVVQTGGRMEKFQLMLWQTALGIATIICWWAAATRASPLHVPAWARLWASVAPPLGALSTGACLLYLRAASSKPQPKLMHLAGVYFLCNTLACSLVSVMLWAAYSHRTKIEYTALACMLLSETVAYGVLQLMILRKVQALASGSQTMVARSWFEKVCMLWFAWVVIFVLRVTHLCEACAHSSGDSTMVESVIGFSFVLALLVFTAVSARTMLQCSDQIRRVSGSGAMCATELAIPRVLLAHVVATTFAQVASALQMVMTVLSQVPGVDVAYPFVVVHSVDIVCNVACALCLSGIATALAESWFPLSGSSDVLGDFETAGKNAHLAAVYGVVAEPMTPVATRAWPPKCVGADV